jgi:hypothetical protein
MLCKQTLKKFEVVVRRECEGRFLGFLGFGFSLLLAFPGGNCSRGIDCELNDKLGLEAVGLGSNDLPIGHERSLSQRTDEQKNETRSRLRVLGSLICNKALEFFFFAIPYIIANSCKSGSTFAGDPNSTWTV